MNEYIVTQVMDILAALGDALPEIDRRNIARFLKYGEHVIAVDTLCEQMCERNVVPGRTVYQQIMCVIADLGMDAKLYQGIVPLPRDEGF
ncbi:MafI family immunity protein [Sorangium sp. So ce124]|uniref:MafI family immunity protein n=1 Tax=Sorangium sp. So ce124 TaxID=3133280 RepID=UPI003F5F6778